MQSRERTRGPPRLHLAMHPGGRGPEDLKRGEDPRTSVGVKGKGPKNLYFLDPYWSTGERTQVPQRCKGRGPKNLLTYLVPSRTRGRGPEYLTFFSFLLLLLTGMCEHLTSRTCCIALQCSRSSCLPFFFLFLKRADPRVMGEDHPRTSKGQTPRT